MAELDLPMRILAVPHRAAVRGVLAFCSSVRLAPDRSPGCCQKPGARLALLTHAVGNGLERSAIAASDPAPAAFSAIVSRFQIPPQYILSFLRGLDDDARVVRYATWQALLGHCRAIGGSLAAVLGCVLGLTHSDAAERLADLGAAIRLTDILGSISGDRDRGLIYLPLDDFVRFGCGQDALSHSTVSPQLRNVIAEQVGRAAALYRSGADGIRWIATERSRLAVALVAVASASRLRQIIRRPTERCGPTHPTLRHLPLAWRIATRRDRPLPAFTP
jgi:phytoene/squalene synthetase